MPEAATAARTTRPARKRTAAAPKAPAAAKPAVPAEAATEVEAAAEVEKFVFELESAGDTKRYSKFVVPEGLGIAGSIYAPLGATRVRVLIEGPAK